MPDLQFQIAGVDAPRGGVAPLLVFKLRLTNAVADEPVQTVVLHAQIQIEPVRRRHNAHEQQRLLDLFGEPERWGKTMHSLVWAQANVGVPPFAGTTVVDLSVPCTYDLNVATAKYLYALEDGEAPLTFLFSGTVFYRGAEGALQAAPIAWDKEASFRLPVQVWKEMMERAYPNSAWLYLHKDVFDRLYDYKIRNGLPTWEETLERLLPVAEGAGER